MIFLTYTNAASAVATSSSPPISTAASPVSRTRWLSSSGGCGSFS